MRAHLLSIAVLSGLGTIAPADDDPGQLPVGSHPPAIEIPYFPDRAHAVVFRNWGLVPPERIAGTIETEVETIRAMGESMGLPPAREDWLEMARRGYITIVRRNWHLLPYEQILTLTGMSAPELSFALKEDDFLFIKLGRLKPRCERVVYSPPDGARRKRLAEIREVVRRHFAGLFELEADPRFSFIDRLGRPSPAPRLEPPERMKKGLRFIYSYFGAYGDPLSDPSLDPYPEGLLERLGARGVNGIWLHTVLRRLAPGGEHFPEFGEGSERRIETLRQLVLRARRFGIGVYLYVNEPRAMPATFFETRPDMAGVREGDSIALCTSDERVRAWLSDALTHVFREVPHLAGVFTITASENLTNCASHFRREGCNRCARRPEAEIIAEVNAVIARGVHRGSARARVIVWDWGWNRHGESPETIERLPGDVWLQSVSEWSLPVTRGGISTRVGEYSLSCPGPGPRALRQWAVARDNGLKTSAKVQFNTTWEIASVPYLPVMDLVAEHCAALSRARVDGMMLSWTVGGYPSPNLQVAARFAASPDAKPGDVLEAMARERYGTEAAASGRQAWTAFSEAFREFPYHGAVMYNAPQQVGAANPWYARATGFAATMVGIPYDDLDRWRGPYPRETFARQFEKVASGWQRGLVAMREAVERAPEGKRESARSDLHIAEAAYTHFASVANQARFVIARDALVDPSTPRRERRMLPGSIRELASREIALARRQFELAWTDARIGFEASNHYFYVPLDCVEKVLSCEHALHTLATGD